MAGRRSLLQTSPQRLRLVAEDIHSGSEPRLGFYFMLVTSSLIASSGLVANSTAVIIGAMLVSPLMTPIFGIALGMLRGEATLFWQAMTAEAVGVVLAVAFPFLFGLAPLAIEPTPEMLARTSPNLLDLFVAIFAGFAGSYALVDERLSPALPGVAIATAIVPPLANTGLCLALGSESGAFGSFLLFGANFVTILIVGLITFAAAGLGRDLEGASIRGMGRRFILPLIAFLITAAYMTLTLQVSIQERTVRKRVEAELRQSFDQRLSASIEDIRIARDGDGDGLQVLVTVRAPEVLHPTEVTQLQDHLSEQLEEDTELIVRTLLSRDVAAVGSSARVSQSHLDGDLFTKLSGSTASLVRIAEQVVLEHIGSLPGMQLMDVNFVEKNRMPGVVATLQGFRPLIRSEIEATRAALRKRLQLPRLELFVSDSPSTIRTAEERYLVEWTAQASLPPEDKLLVGDLRRIVREETRATLGLFCSGVYLHAEEDSDLWRVLVEVVGPRAPEPTAVAALQQSVAQRIPRNLELSVWFRAEVVVTPDGLDSFQEFTRPTLEKRIESLPEIFR